MSFNKIILVGRLGRDPELKHTPQGVPVCSFSLATSEKQGKGGAEGGGNDVTTWFNVTLWREKAEVAGKYLAKGRLVYIEGRLSTREYQDRNGVTRTSLDVTGTEFHFIDSRPEEGLPVPPVSAETPYDDIPY